MTKVKPLSKKGSKTYPSNFRPIFLQPLLSKFFERFVLDQTEEFLSLKPIQDGLLPDGRPNSPPPPPPPI